jgi:hypothetical protein
LRAYAHPNERVTGGNKSVTEFPDWERLVKYIITTSTPYTASNYKFNKKTSIAEMTLKVDNPYNPIVGDYDTFEKEIKDIYGELAADTWMEGDISLNDDYEVFLDLVSVTKK